MLEEILKDMENYGRPGVAKLSNGWWCKVEIFVTGKGINFTIDSDAKHATPLAAAQQCHERMRDAMRGLGEQMKRIPE